MISKFILENLTTNKQITFGQDIDCDYVFQDDGVDWGSASATHNTYEYPRQVGCSISSTKIGTRDIQIEGYVYYVLTEKERYGKTYEDMKNFAYEKIKLKKSVLNELINPNDYVKIYIGDYYIQGKPNASIIYGKNGRENNRYFCKFYFSVFCNNPMFKKNTISRTNLKGSLGNFKFPLSIPEEGIFLSVRQDFLIVSVENEGGVPIGGRIILTAKGNILNPEVENLNTGEKIRINKQMTLGETVIINTVEGSDRGVIGGFENDMTNYLQYWDFNNSWFSFGVGTTLLGYKTDDATETLLDVVIEINPEKFSLEEM